jgi:hypothetical protein
MLRRTACYLLLVWCAVPVLAKTAGGFRTETRPVAGGAELVTVFGRMAGEGEVPLLVVLRDTLGDADSQDDRLRYIWILTSAKPTILQRAEASLPFFYWRPDPTSEATRRPSPAIDLGAAYRGLWSSAAQLAAQFAAADPSGALIRTSTRSYRNNIESHRQGQLMEALAVLSQLEAQPESALSQADLLEMETRLTLAGKMLGGLVSAGKLPDAYMKERTRDTETRGHNWEMLRQRAEMNGLYFEPLGLNGASTHALLWIAAEDLGSDRPFDAQFLGIADPYRDSRLKDWHGYRLVRDGKEMIPLALYALDYPKVPLLLVDFRDTGAPRRREMVRHAVTDTITGVLGISKFGNWPFLAGSSAFEFVRTRHGSPNNRMARLRAYAEVREWMALDGSIDPGLRTELQKRMEEAHLNPAGESIFDQAKIARGQYAALLRYAEDPEGLPARLRRDREGEMAAYRHTWKARAGMKLATVATLGIYSHHERDVDELAQERRVARQMVFLAKVAQSGPQAEVVWNMEDVRRAVAEVSAVKLSPKSAVLVAKIMRQTGDHETRLACERALMTLDASVDGGQ